MPRNFCSLFIFKCFSINSANDSKIISVQNNVTNGHDNNETR